MGYIFDGKDSAQVDDLSLALKTIGAEHAVIHEGRGFSLDYQNESLGNNEEDIILLQITKAVHWAASFSSEGDTYVEFVEATKGAHLPGSPATPLPVNNRNRFSSKASPLSAYRGAVLASPEGQRLYDGELLGGEKSKTFGASDAAYLEWILNPQYDYFMRIRNDSGGSERVQMHAFLYSPRI